MKNNRAAVITQLAEIRGITKTEATAILNDVSEIIVKNLETDGDVVKLPPLGTFKLVHKPSRQCRNPRSGETMMTTPKNVIKLQ